MQTGIIVISYSKCRNCSNTICQSYDTVRNSGAGMYIRV